MEEWPWEKVRRAEDGVVGDLKEGVEDKFSAGDEWSLEGLADVEGPSDARVEPWVGEVSTDKFAHGEAKDGLYKVGDAVKAIVDDRL